MTGKLNVCKEICCYFSKSNHNKSEIKLTNYIRGYITDSQNKSMEDKCTGIIYKAISLYHRTTLYTRVLNGTTKNDVLLLYVVC